MPTSTADAMRSANEAHEELAKNVPIAAEYIELRDKVFAIADDLGIGNQVREIYHDTAFGVKAGTAAGSAAAYVLAGGGVAAAYTGAVAVGAAVGMAAGGIVGAVIGFAASFFSSDDDDEEKAREKQRQANRAAYEASVKAYARYLLSPITLSSLISENEKMIAPHKGVTTGPLYKAQQLTVLYKALRVKLTATEQKLFCLGAERGRITAGLTAPGIFAGPLFRNAYARHIHDQLAMRLKLTNQKMASMTSDMRRYVLKNQKRGALPWKLALATVAVGYGYRVLKRG